MESYVELAATIRKLAEQTNLTDATIRTLVDETQAQDQPILTYVVGQPASGKSALIRQLPPGLNVDSDLLRLLFVTEETTLTGDPIALDEDPRNLVATLGKSLLSAGMEARQSIYMEHTLSNSTYVRMTIAEAIRRGYQVNAEVMAVPRKVSLVRIATRYLAETEMNAPYPRWTSLDVHDRAYAAVPRNLRIYPRLFTQIRVWDHELKQRYKGDNVREAAAMVERVRNEPLPDNLYDGLVDDLDALSARDPLTTDVIGAIFVER